MGYIADALRRAKILRDSDWKGDLVSSMNTALARFVSECGAGSLSRISIGRLAFGDDIEQIGVGFCPSDEMRRDKPNWTRGGFCLLNCFTHARYALGYECSQLNRVQPNLGYTVFGMVASTLETYCEAITPHSALWQINEWEYSNGGGESQEGEDEDEEPGGYSEAKVRAQNPAQILDGTLKRSWKAPLRRFASVPLDRSYTDDVLHAHSIAVDALTVWELNKALNKLPQTWEAQCHHIEESPAPGICLSWHPGPEDAVARFADDWLQMMGEGDVSEVMAFHGFWIPTPGWAIRDNSIDLAIKRLGIELRLFGVCERLVMALSNDAPVSGGRPLLQTIGSIDDLEEERGFVTQL